MKSKYFKLILSIIFSVCFVQFALGESVTLKEQKSFYKACLQDICLKCKNKCCLKQSKFKKLRACAELAERKANFVRQNHDKLIAEMMNLNMPLKAYKIKYFINQQFFAYQRSSMSQI